MADWIEPGKRAPAFTLTADDGGKVRLADLQGGPVVLYFYPKDDTPGCTREACAFRDRKKELQKLLRLTRETGFTIIPIRLFINDKGLAKLVIAVAKGKKQYDKRQSLKEKEDKRAMDRMFKQ